LFDLLEAVRVSHALEVGASEASSALLKRTPGAQNQSLPAVPARGCLKATTRSISVIENIHAIERYPSILHLRLSSNNEPGILRLLKNTMEMQVEALKSKLAIAMDIKTAVDGHSHKHHNDDNRDLHEIFVSDLADEFHQGTPPSKDKLHALFDCKVNRYQKYMYRFIKGLCPKTPISHLQERLAMHIVKAPHVSEEEQLWQEQFDRAVATLEK
jgi:hypothetical protein